MDVNNICYGCMQEKVNNETTCPHCGYINGSEEGEHYYLNEGTVLNDRYLIGKVLGHGGFGITYIGFDKRLSIRVAIKEYLPSDVATRLEGQSVVKTFSGDKKEQFDYGLIRFLDEAKVLARYNEHPCIVSTSDFFEENNTAYLVMEYLEGIPLNEYLKRKGGKISYDETLEIMMPIMDALREVHESGMIHRDISPDNIYITSKGQIKLLDFGAARFALGEKSKSLSVVLKPGYAPPEQYSTKGKQGPWTDVYSVAATMYRMISGENISEAVDRFIDDTIDMPADLNTDLQEVLIKALQVKHEDRYQSIEDFQDVLLGNKDVNNDVSVDNMEEVRQEIVIEELPTNNSGQDKNLGNKKKWIIVVIVMITIVLTIMIKEFNNNRSVHTDITTNTDETTEETEKDKSTTTEENEPDTVTTEEEISEIVESIEEGQQEETIEKDEETSESEITQEESSETTETEEDIFETTEEDVYGNISEDVYENVTEDVYENNSGDHDVIQFPESVTFEGNDSIDDQVNSLVDIKSASLTIEEKDFDFILTMVEIPSDIIVNSSHLSENQREYCWEVEISDGIKIFYISVTNWKGKNEYESTIQIENHNAFFQSDVWIRGEDSIKRLYQVSSEFSESQDTIRIFGELPELLNELVSINVNTYYNNGQNESRDSLKVK